MLFINRVLRKIPGPETEEAIRQAKLHYKELHGICFLPNIIRIIKSRRMRWMRHVWEEGKSIQSLVRKCEWKRPLGRPRHT
jgi:hypothetical protein